MTQTLFRTDHQLKSAIFEELSRASNLHPGRIGVSLTDGAVTLSGWVQTHPEKEAAVRAAMRVLGSPRSPTRSSPSTFRFQRRRLKPHEMGADSQRHSDGHVRGL